MVYKVTFPRVVLNFFVFCFLLSSCSAIHNKDAEVSELVAYNAALADLKAGRYTAAQSGFERLINLYPVSYWTMHAQLDIGYIKYELGKYQEAASMMEALISMYPASKSVEYAYYLRANAYYSLVEDVERDGSSAEKALQAASEYLKLFENGEYVVQMREISLDLHNHLALKRFSSCRDSLYNGYYLPAIKCFESIAFEKNSADGEYVAESWYRLIEAYLAIGLKDLAVRSIPLMEKKITGEYAVWVQRAKSLVQ